MMTEMEVKENNETLKQNKKLEYPEIEIRTKNILTGIMEKQKETDRKTYKMNIPILVKLSRDKKKVIEKSKKN